MVISKMQRSTIDSSSPSAYAKAVHIDGIQHMKRGVTVKCDHTCMVTID